MKNVPIMIVDKVKDLMKFKGDGIIGLGRKSDSEIDFTILDALKK